MEANFLNEDGAKLISKELSNLKNVGHLELSLKFNNEYQNNDIKLAKLVTCFESMTHLKCLSLTIKEKSKIGDNGIYQISNNLKYLVNLNSLSLIIGDQNNISDKGIKSLKDSIRNLINLVKIKIHVNDRWNRQIILELVLEILQLQNLIEFDSRFYQQKQYLFGNKIYSQYTDNSNSINQNLKRISLYIQKYYYDQSDQLGERSLADIILNCKNLEVLKSNINLCYEQGNQQQKQESLLNKKMRELCLFQKKMRELSISLHNIPNDVYLEKILQNISNIQQLKKLDLDLHFNKSTLKLKQYLNNCFDKLNLKELRINCTYYCSELENVNSFIIEPLQYLSQLIVLDLKFIVDDQLTLFQELAECFECLDNLRVLNLSQHHAKNYSGINKESLSNLLQALVYLINLNDITLNFNTCDQKQLYEELYKTLLQLDNLRKVNLTKILPVNIAKQYHSKMSKKYLGLVQIVR